MLTYSDDVLITAIEIIDFGIFLATVQQYSMDPGDGVGARSGTSSVPP